MSFGARLTEVRKGKKLTQEALGKGLATGGEDASKSVVYGWEKDQHYPRVDQLKLICQKLDCSADYLLFGRVAESSLSNEVAEVAAAIDQLPARQREWVLMTVSHAIAMARETLKGLPQMDEETEDLRKSLSDERVRKRS